jgi:pimeloyl-ACP methyl ester carboxylesterase
MSEEIVTFGSTRSLVGVIHRPDGGAARSDLPAVLMLNAGILHRVGPNRLYVRIARLLEQSGFTVLRFDVWGIGDSQEQSHLQAAGHDQNGHGQSGNGARPSRTFVDDTLEAFKLLRERVGAERFMLMGICMGARIALEVASRDPRVESLVLMEGIYVKTPRYYISRVLDPEKWRRVVTGESQMVRKARRVLSRRRGGGSNGNGARPQADRPDKPAPTLVLDESRDKNMKETLAGLLARGTKIMLVFRDGNEISYNYRLRRDGDDIFAIGLPRGLDVAFIRFADHTFTPLVSQELLLKSTMRWIESAYPARPVAA